MFSTTLYNLRIILMTCLAFALSCSKGGDSTSNGSSGAPVSGCTSVLNGGTAACSVTTIAGSAQGSTTSSDTDATGNLARFLGPRGLASDGTNLYVVDSLNRKIRQMVISSKAVTTIAGQAAGCYPTCGTGDTDATGTAARFGDGMSGPQGIATDGTNLYVADRSNNKIRKIVISSGVVTTIAGPSQGITAQGDTDATGNAARFRNPTGIATDGTNLYVADSGNNKIRQIVISSGVVTTLAGPAPGANTSGDTDSTGNAARFNFPQGIVVNGTNLYVADSFNNKVRKIVISSGAVTTLAGPAQGGTTSGDSDGTGNAALFSSPNGIASSGTNLYVADQNNNKIRKIVISSGVVTTIAGPSQGTTTSGDTDAAGNSASFNSPVGIVTDATSIYVTDTSNNKIRKLD